MVWFARVHNWPPNVTRAQSMRDLLILMETAV